MVPLHINIVVLGNMPSGINIIVNIHVWCSRVNTLQIWIQMRHKQNKKIFSVYVEAWTQISRMKYKSICQRCHPAALNCISCFSSLFVSEKSN
jgi:hypothetical protein